MLHFLASFEVQFFNISKVLWSQGVAELQRMEVQGKRNQTVTEIAEDLMSDRIYLKGGCSGEAVVVQKYV